MEATPTDARVAQVVVDVPARAIDRPFDYAVPDDMVEVEVGSCVLVDFGNRPVVGYVVGVASESECDSLKPVRALLAGPYFDSVAVRLATWIAREYVAPLSEAVRLFGPPGGSPRAARSASGAWELRRAGAGPVDDRWVSLTSEGVRFAVRKGATMQRAVLDALSAGPVRAVELAADLGAVAGAVKALEHAGAVRVERRRRVREAVARERSAPRHERLMPSQVAALDAIAAAGSGGRVLLDGVTGSGKTEVYLRAIEDVVKRGGSAIVLVPEISLTPQTVGRFRSRFGDLVAVLHSRLSAGERFDQWDLARSGDARVVVGARSALFAPVRDLGLVVIDEEHEQSYKQGSAPRYDARDVAARLCDLRGAVLVLGSATPRLESLAACERGACVRVPMPERVPGRELPAVTVVDMGVEFAAGNRSMFSRELARGLDAVAEAGRKAVLLLNRRGFASFLLCRECGFVPGCEDCSTSLTFHEVGARLMCHHCGRMEDVPAACPRCGSVYLRQFGAGTQRVEAEVVSRWPALPVVRMDADTTAGKGGHEQALARFEQLDAGILLGTQMIAKGLDYPDVTLVGVLNADTGLHLPDFRASERTYQLLEQVSGRAGRGEDPGRVIVQTYWP
ncbi:MAG: primosomal protein N', partial [Actinobacteria bacterium]